MTDFKKALVKARVDAVMDSLDWSNVPQIEEDPVSEWDAMHLLSPSRSPQDLIRLARWNESKSQLLSKK